MTIDLETRLRDYGDTLDRATRNQRSTGPHPGLPVGEWEAMQSRSATSSIIRGTGAVASSQQLVWLRLRASRSRWSTFNGCPTRRHRQHEQIRQLVQCGRACRRVLGEARLIALDRPERGRAHAALVNHSCHAVGSRALVGLQRHDLVDDRRRCTLE